MKRSTPCLNACQLRQNNVNVMHRQQRHAWTCTVDAEVRHFIAILSLADDEQ
jgi:hypothetical protein